MKKMRFAAAVLLLMSSLFMLVTPASAASQTYSFFNITNNNPGDAAIGEAQLSVTVSDVVGQPTQVLFTFNNAGPAASSIADIYFDDGTLLGISTIYDDGACQPAGTSFSVGASPSDLPGGNAVGFQVTAGFSADSDSPIQPCGVNPGEDVAILFDLQAGMTYANVISDLQTGELRIGIHVQGFATGGSESFVNRPPTAISLAAFTARAAGGKVVLNWVTGAEINNAGFNVYRSTSANGPRIRVNTQLMAAKGEGASGARYQLLDTPGYGAFYYWLEDVEFTGTTQLHGPVRLTVVSPIRRPVYRPVSPAGD
jgi:hypothetical protein